MVLVFFHNLVQVRKPIKVALIEKFDDSVERQNFRADLFILELLQILSQLQGWRLAVRQVFYCNYHVVAYYKGLVF
jgi:hypothetical protein